MITGATSTGQQKPAANGAAALLVEPGDLVINATFAGVDDAEVASYQPRIVFVDDQNVVQSIKAGEIAGPA